MDRIVATSYQLAQNAQEIPSGPIGPPLFHPPDLPYPVPMPQMFPGCFYQGIDLGPALSVVVQSSKPFGAPGSFSAVFHGPALAIFAAFLVLLAAVTMLGYIAGFFRARVRSLKGSIPDLSTPDAYNSWRRERNSTLLTFILIISGIACFLFGFTADIELQIPYAKVVTSAPGIVLILLGYLLWTRAYAASSKGASAANQD